MVEKQSLFWQEGRNKSRHRPRMWHRRHHAGRDSQRGVALLAVLWIFILLAVMAGEFARSMREEALAAQNFWQETDAYYAALAGLHRTLYTVFTFPETLALPEEQAVGLEKPEEEEEQEIWMADGVWQEGEVLGKGYRVRIIDEGGKIPLNGQNEITLSIILQNLGIEEAQRSIIVDSILDWTDPDDLHRMNGAEDEYYQSLPRPYYAKNDLFTSVEELLLVRGISADLFYGVENEEGRKPGLREIFSVWNTTNTVNLRTAPPAVLQALVGVSREDADDFITRRQEGERIDQLFASPLQASGANIRATYVPASTLTIEVQGQHMGPSLAVVVNKSQGVPRYLRWYDRLVS